jgi:hypothetical protein
MPYPNFNCLKTFEKPLSPLHVPFYPTKLANFRQGQEIQPCPMAANQPSFFLNQATPLSSIRIKAYGLRAFLFFKKQMKKLLLLILH